MAAAAGDVVAVRVGDGAAASGPEADVLRGRLAIPWNAINDAAHQGLRPALLRFNFVQHRTAGGESASWAGPVDFGRDENFMGLLYLRSLGVPGRRPLRGSESKGVRDV